MTDTAKHTPGPLDSALEWAKHYALAKVSEFAAWAESHGLHTGQTQDLRRLLTEVFLRGVVYASEHPLYAAAPDLLEACERALAWYGLDGDGITDPTRQEIVAAIAKAKPE